MKGQACVYLQSDHWAICGSNVTGDFWNGSVAIYSYQSDTGAIKIVSEWVYELGGLTSITRVISEDKSIALICGTMTGEILVFRLAPSSFELTEPAVHLYHSAPVLCLASHGNYLTFSVITGGKDNKLNLLTITPQEVTPISSVIAHYKPIRSLSWIDDTMFISSSDDHDVKYWVISEGAIVSKPLKSISFDSSSYCIASWSMGKYVAMGQDDKVVIYINSLNEENKPIVQNIMNPMGPVKSLSFRPKLDNIVLSIGTDDGKVRLFEIDEKQNPKEIESSQQNDFIRNIQWSPEGNYYVCLGWEEKNDNAGFTAHAYGQK